MNRPYLLVLAMLAAWPALAQDPKPSELTPYQQKLDANAKQLTREGLRLYQQGKAAEAVKHLEDAQRIMRQLYPAASHPHGQIDLANSIGNLGFVLQAQGKLDQAEPMFREALAMCQALYPAAKYPDGHNALATCCDRLGSLLVARGAYEKAAPFIEQSLAMRRKLFPEATYPQGDRGLAISLNNMGYLLQDQGALERAEPLFREALAMHRKLYPETAHPRGHADIARSLNNLGSLLKEKEAHEEAAALHEEALAMRQRLYPKAEYPNGHPDLASSLNNLACFLRDQGAYEKAAPLFEQALAMWRGLYPESAVPDGHPHIASGLSNLGSVLYLQGEYDKAAPYVEQALAMRRKLFPPARHPDGHPAIASGLNNLGTLRRTQRQFEQAAAYYDQALTMRRQLYPVPAYPDGHDQLAGSLQMMGMIHEYLGAYDAAKPYYDQALAMHRRLYPPSKHPDGHADIVDGLHCQGALLDIQGRSAEAKPLLEQALEMQRRLAQPLITTAAEFDALAFLVSRPAIRDDYLSVTRRLGGADADAYRAVWSSKATVTRLLERRRAAVRAAGTQSAGKLARLKEIRRRTEHLLLSTRLPSGERDALLAELADERDRLERTLIKELPVWSQATAGASRSEVDLAAALPADAVFIDFVAYTFCEQDPQVKGKAGVRRTLAYAAFILAPGRPAARVELGPVEPIDEAIHEWRRQVDEREASRIPARLRLLLWEPLARHLPTSTRAVYLSPDGLLARLPWAALPGAKPDTVLIEEFALAIVPHGPFLLEALHAQPRRPGPEAVLLLGDVAYNSAKWPALSGARAEIDAIARLAPGATVLQRGAEATRARLIPQLSRAHIAHLATHGQFLAKELKVESQRERDARAGWQEGSGLRVRLTATTNPLAFTGLVLADGEVMTGLSIADMSLKDLKLVTLSACDTGLGQLTEGEGVQGLQRAFHLAGCPNVVASLWKVNDAATAALMAKFYHELWVNKKPPIEALREAQLTIYRRPDLIATLASAERGLKLEQALNAKSTTPAESKSTTPTKLWAAFVLSGVGK